MNLLRFTLYLAFWMLCPVLVAGQVSLLISDTTITANNEHEIPISIELSEEDSVLGFNATFEFDINHLNYVSFNTENTISDSLLVFVNQKGNQILLSLSSVHPIKTGGELIKIVFNPGSESVSTFSNLEFRVNEEKRVSGTAEGIINSITSPIVLSVSGDTAEVRNNILLDFALTGLKGRELSSFDFLIEYQNTKFDFVAFEIDQDLPASNYVVVPEIISDSLIRVRGNSSTPVSEDFAIGRIQLFAKEEGEFSVDIIEASINDGEIEVDLDLRSISITEDKTAPDRPLNLNVVFSETEESGVVDISWDSVSATDLKEYVLTRDLRGEIISIFSELNNVQDTLILSGTYIYFVQAIDESGNLSELSDSKEVTITSVSTETVDESLPTSYSLSQNFPNPFNPTTTISFGLPETADVKVEIYNALGQKVSTLVAGKFNAGWNKINFDASGFSSGLYIYRLITPTRSITKKMTLIK
ncbi:MAG: T9SS type A sorting domain-containing protein [Balneola sp.]